MASPRNKRKRKRGKGRLGPLFKLLCAGAVAVALTMGATVFFQVETVAVTGNSRYSQEEIIKATGIQTGDNLFRMNKYQIAHQVLQGLPYVEELTIRRALPSTIVITVKEWDAVARVEAPGTSAVVQTVPQAPAEPVQPDSSQAGDSADQSQAAGNQSAAGDIGGDSSSEDTQEDAKPATQAWLISVEGKLLEPAPADSTATSVTGITPLSPRAGEMLVLSQEEQPKLTALLALLQGLEDHDMLAAPDQSQGTGDQSAAGDSSGDSSAKDDQESAKPATQAWLISVGGKLLEPAPADSTAISVTGITPLAPRAGEMLVLSQEEQPKLTALLALLQGLEDHDMLADTASIALGDTHVELRYLDRFTVKLPLTGDLDYKLQALKAAVPEAEKKLGEQTTGTFDLTQESITAVYTPD